jgi:hypothetical protein
VSQLSSAQQTAYARNPAPLVLLPHLHLSPVPLFSLYLAFSIYSALGFSYFAQKNLPLFLASQVQNLLISSRSRLTDWLSMLVWAMSSGRLTVWKLDWREGGDRTQGRNTKHAAEVLGAVDVAGAFAFPFGVFAGFPEVADL